MNIKTDHLWKTKHLDLEKINRVNYEIHFLTLISLKSLNLRHISPIRKENVRNVKILRIVILENKKYMSRFYFVEGE